jgi:hypothetical protein
MDDGLADRPNARPMARPESNAMMVLAMMIFSFQRIVVRAGSNEHRKR